MNHTVEFIFDFGSPTAYLAYTQLPNIASQRKIEILWTPILLGGVHKASGNQSPAFVPAKGKWMRNDIAKWARKYGVAFKANPYFPINTISLMRAAVGIQMETPDLFLRYVDAIYKAFWTHEINLGEIDHVKKVLEDADIDAKAVFALVSNQAVKDKLKANSDTAVDRGVFGAPTFFYRDEMFFGQDRLDFLAEAMDNSHK